MPPSQPEGGFLLSPSDDFADLLWGAQAIADYIGKSYRQTVYLLSTKRLPAKKIGAMWIARRSKLRACLLGEEAA
jgi:hypothetical protein